MSRSFLALVSTLLISNAIFASDDERYLYALGYGESESEALQDAKIQIALNLLSVVEVNEKSSMTKGEHGSEYFFSQSSSI
ncbi:hypothetical protein REH73_21310, partial [Vibrio sinaloensis]